MEKLLDAVKGLFGGGPANPLAVPLMDGALKPNNTLEDAVVLLESEGLNDIAADPVSGHLYIASGSTVLVMKHDEPVQTLHRFDSTVSALAVCASGRLVVALGDRVIRDPGSRDEFVLTAAQGQRLHSVNALHATADGRIWIVDSSSEYGCEQWAHDLMSKGSSGRLIESDASNGDARVLAANLAYPYGVCTGPDGQPVLSLSWTHRVTGLNRQRHARQSAPLPGYPARLSNAAGGGYWLSVFAARTQLVEFVLREDGYRKEMMRTVEPKYWVAPALKSGDDYLEPLQFGSVKTMGIHKPWSPARSYGLVVRLDESLVPTGSWHSRVGGQNHGVVATVEHEGSVVVLCKGPGRLLRVPLGATASGVEL